jgi:hypothetical protein
LVSIFETEDIDRFTEQKMAQNEQYEQDLERTKVDKVDVDNQKMTAEELLPPYDDGFQCPTCFFMKQ